jgi:lipoprotein signal peptidase
VRHGDQGIQPTTELRRTSAARTVWVTAGLVLFDQVSKFVAAHAIASTVVLPRNPAYAFGIVGGSPAQLVIISIAVIALVLVTVGPLAARNDMSPGIPALITAGMLSNTIDRIRLGAVRDFIVTPWAIINVADLCVIAGIVGLMITLVRRASSCDYRQALVRDG